jgi:segregation and condensation protein A
MLTQINHYALENFEGPLDFLLCLIQKEEIDIYEIPLQELIQQCLQKLTEWKERQIEIGAEFIGIMAYFVLLKSRMLLPQIDDSHIDEELEEDPRFEIIHHLIDYCRFKQASKELTRRQEQQSACFYRGLPEYIYQKPLGIDDVSIEDLSLIFKEMMGKAKHPVQQIFEENWRVSDKINTIRLLLRENSIFPLHDLFSPQKSRIELIVIFLAILESMKLGLITVGRQAQTSTLVICAKKEEL